MTLFASVFLSLLLTEMINAHESKDENTFINIIVNKYGYSYSLFWLFSFPESVGASTVAPM